MGVWSNVYVYQPSVAPALASKLLGYQSAQSYLSDLELFAEKLGSTFFKYGELGKGFYDGFCEDSVLAEVEDATFVELINESKNTPRAKWISANFEGADFKLIDQINLAMDQKPDVTGDYRVYGVSVVVGQICIEDEYGENLFYSNSMMCFYGDSSPNDGCAYADHFLLCEPIRTFLGHLTSAKPCSKWLSALVVS